MLHKEFVEGLSRFNLASLDSAKRLTDINVRMWERLGARQLEVANAYVTGSVKQLELLGSAKSVQDVVAGQVQLAADLNEKVIDHAKETAKILVDTRGELAGWVEEGLNSVNPEVVTKATPRKKAA